MQLIEEWRVRGGLILMSKNSFFGTWCLVFRIMKFSKKGAFIFPIR